MDRVAALTSGTAPSCFLLWFRSVIEMLWEMVNGDRRIESDHDKGNESLLDRFPRKMLTESQGHVHKTYEDGHHTKEHTSDRTEWCNLVCHRNIRWGTVLHLPRLVPTWSLVTILCQGSQKFNLTCGNNNIRVRGRECWRISRCCRSMWWLQQWWS